MLLPVMLASGSNPVASAHTSIADAVFLMTLPFMHMGMLARSREVMQYRSGDQKRNSSSVPVQTPEPNRAIDSDALPARWRAPVSARHRGRWTSPAAQGDVLGTRRAALREDGMHARINFPATLRRLRAAP